MNRRDALKSLLALPAIASGIPLPVIACNSRGEPFNPQPILSEFETYIFDTTFVDGKLVLLDGCGKRLSEGETPFVRVYWQGGYVGTERLS